MKIPKVEKLPSGRYRVQVQVGGQRYGETFDTPEEAQFWAAGIKTRIKDARKPARRLTVGEAADQYIERRDAVLSPATVAGYKRIRKNLLPPIAATLLPELTQESIQRWVNRMVKAGKSPKTVANAHGFLSAVLSEFRPDVKLTTRLPQKEKHEIQIPTKAEVQAIAETCRGTKYELPIMLAICLGLRASEIRGLRWSDIDGEYVNIHTAIVEGENGAAEKGPKSYSGARRVHLPAYLRDLLARTPHASAKKPVSRTIASTICATSMPPSCLKRISRINTASSVWVTPPTICSRQPTSIFSKRASAPMTPPSNLPSTI